MFPIRYAAKLRLVKSQINIVGLAVLLDTLSPLDADRVVLIGSLVHCYDVDVTIPGRRVCSREATERTLT